MKLFVAIAGGVSQEEGGRLVGIEALKAAGFEVAIAVLGGMSPERARAELMAALAATGYDAILFQGAKVETDPKSILAMARFDQLDVIGAPCRISKDNPYYNVGPVGDSRDGVAPAGWVGLDSILVRKKAVNALYRANTHLVFDSQVMEGAAACAVFNPIVVDMGLYDSSKAGRGMYLSDGEAFCHRLTLVGIPIFVYPAARTVANGVAGCMADDAPKEEAPEEKRSLILDASGKRPLRERK